MRVREGTVTSTGSHPHSRWSLCAQGHRILSPYQASYPAIVDIATSLSLNTLFGFQGDITIRQPDVQAVSQESNQPHKRNVSCGAVRWGVASSLL
jgi:hypothetical protein